MSDNVIIFGAGQRGREFLSILNMLDVHPVCFLDNGNTGELEGVPIRKPVYLKDVLVVVTPLGYEEEIRIQLQELGYSSDKIILMDDYLSGSYSLDILEKIRNKNRSKKNKYPNTIQFPITYKCNFDCVMCGMKSASNYEDKINPTNIKKMLNSELFKEVRYVGVNGGEPFIKTDFVECLQAISIMLPKMEEFNIITNGYFTDKIIADLKNLRATIKKDVRINISVSVDGVNDMQDFHRGKKNSFIKANETIDLLKQIEGSIIDRVDIICTITQYNIFRIKELLEWAKDKELMVNYNIATINNRIFNEYKYKDFSLFEDIHAKCMAIEFFYSLYLKTRSERYYAIYLFLLKGERYADCPCMHNDWVTITPRGELIFCAPMGVCIGDLLNNEAMELLENYKTNSNNITEKRCNKCGQYCYNLDLMGIGLQKIMENNQTSWTLQ